MDNVNRRKKQFCFLCCAIIQATLKHPKYRYLSMSRVNGGGAERR